MKNNVPTHPFQVQKIASKTDSQENSLCSSKYREKRHSLVKFNLEKAVLHVEQEYETICLTDV